MDINVRLAVQTDYADVVLIMDQVQALHVEWRPDIYRPTDCILTEEHFEELVMNEDIVFVDTMAVDESYRGKGVGHCFFDKLKQLKKERKLDGIELQVNARNKAAYRMYSHYGFTEKSINMELLDIE